MANEQNLRPVRTKKEARERGRKGGIASGKSRAQRKTFKEELLLLLQNGDTQKSISVALVMKALNGDLKAFEVLRDTIGEKPTDKIDMNANVSYEDAIRKVADSDEY